MNPQAAPEEKIFTEMTVAAICLDVSRKAQLECGIDGALTEEIVTWAIAIDPRMVTGFSQQEQRLFFIEDPSSVAHCGYTAQRIFEKLTTSERATGAFANLALHIATAAKNRLRMIFHARYLNHEFIIVVRNDITELLQSFHTMYTLGQYLMNRNTTYPPELLQCYLIQLTSPYVQQQLFFCPLDGNAHRAEYDYAPLKTDKEIWESLYMEAVSGVACYQSLR